MKCSFCNAEMERGTGLLYVKKDGKVLPFCSRKCRMNSLKLGRKPRKLKWTQPEVKVESSNPAGKK
ncbi:MAG: 50S ribosomal protein L24e [Candidatus Micrarchaeia archaeon]